MNLSNQIMTGATYVSADVLHLVGCNSPHDIAELRRVVATKSAPSPFHPHTSPCGDGVPVLGPPAGSSPNGYLLYNRMGCLHSHHASDIDLADWMGDSGGWRVARVDGLKSLVRETSARMAIVASETGLYATTGPIADPIAFCRGALRFCEDDEDLVSADEPLAAQVAAASARCAQADLIRHASHILAIAAAAERAGGDGCHSPGAFADRISAMTAITDFSKRFAPMRDSARDAPFRAAGIKRRLEAAERTSAS